LEQQQQQQAMETTILTSMNDRGYEIVKKIGGGTYGAVYKVMSITSGQLFALKVGNRSTRVCCISNSGCLCTSPDAAKDLRKKEACGVGHEITVLSTLSHVNIMNILDVGDFTTSTNETRPFYVMPLALHRTTRDMSTRFRPFLPTFITHVSGALAYLHDTAHIAHMDLTNQNIVIKDGPHFVICDFGAARPIDPSTKGLADMTKNKYAHDCLTTYEYAAPEIFKCQIETQLEQIDKCAADVWSFAMCILGFCGWFVDKKNNKHYWEQPTKHYESFLALMTMKSSQRIPYVNLYVQNTCISRFICEEMLRHNATCRTRAVSIYDLFKTFPPSSE
jgi:serine/threonine protein kinase